VTSQGPVGSGSVTATSGTLQATIDIDIVAGARPSGVISATIPLSGTPYGTAISASGLLLVIALDGTLHRAQLPGGAFTSANTPGFATDLALNPAETRAWVSQDGSLVEYDITGGPPVMLRTIPVTASEALYGIEVSADGSTVLVGGGSGTVFFVSTTSGTVVHETNLSFGAGVIHLTRGADGSKVYASSPSLGKVVEIDVATRAMRDFSLSGGGAQGVVTAVDGSELYVVTEEGAIQIFDIATLARTVVPIDCGGYGLGITPDNTQLYIACSFGSAVKIFDRTSRTIVGTLPLPGTGRRLAVAPNGLTVAVAVESGHVVIIE
jgi:DNA-binding beta-propeller fold protein YncE